jgi:methyltransferase (TIGR00027 family)
MTTPIQDVSETALMVAMWRAQEENQSQPLFRDHLASTLAGPRGREIAAGLPKIRAKMGGWMMAIRTRIIDEMIETAIQNGVDTIVNLGAGLDTRPYRMNLPKDLRWIEVDVAKIIDLKESRLVNETPACRLTRIRCDLAIDEARKKVLADIAATTKKALVLTEGVIPYLTEEEVAALAENLREYGQFHYWVTDYFSPFVHQYRKKRSKKIQMENAPFRFEPKEYFSFFRKHGWKQKEICYINDAAKRLKRPPPLFLRAWAFVRWPFSSKKARAEMEKSYAYVLFEPVSRSNS